MSLPDKFKISKEDLLLLIYGEKVKGYEEYFVEIDLQDGIFDIGKSAVTNFPITIHHSEEDDSWEGKGEWYDEYNGYSLSEEIEFTKHVEVEEFVFREDQTSDAELKSFAAGYDQCIEDMANKDDGYNRVKKTIVWYYIADYGDGSGDLRWFLTELDAQTAQKKNDYMYDTIDFVETYEGSNIHKMALKNSTI